MNLNIISDNLAIVKGLGRMGGIAVQVITKGDGAEVLLFSGLELLEIDEL